MTKTTSVCLAILAVVVSAQGCIAEVPFPEVSGRAIYDIPESFDPEPGALVIASNVRRIDAPEFSFMLTEQVLAENVAGFGSGLNGMIHDTMVVVRVFDPSIHSGWTATAEDIQQQLEIWTQTGDMKTACMSHEKEPLTGYHKYYTFCDPQPSRRSNFWLMDRIPDSNEAPPEGTDYIKGVCREIALDAEKGEEYITRCKFGRRTDWNDQYSFWLKGENLRYLEEVEAYIKSLLLSWRNPDFESNGS